jgi:hypothetical protein
MIAGGQNAPGKTPRKRQRIYLPDGHRTAYKPRSVPISPSPYPRRERPPSIASSLAGQAASSVSGLQSNLAACGRPSRSCRKQAIGKALKAINVSAGSPARGPAREQMTPNSKKRAFEGQWCPSRVESGRLLAPGHVRLVDAKAEWRPFPAHPVTSPGLRGVTCAGCATGRSEMGRMRGQS